MQILFCIFIIYLKQTKLRNFPLFTNFVISNASDIETYVHIKHSILTPCIKACDYEIYSTDTRNMLIMHVMFSLCVKLLNTEYAFI